MDTKRQEIIDEFVASPAFNWWVALHPGVQVECFGERFDGPEIREARWRLADVVLRLAIAMKHRESAHSAAAAKAIRSRR